MPNSHHFYGVSAGKGGINVDESTLSPDANYWSSGARGAQSALIKILGEDEAWERLAAIWHKGRTWKDICIDAEAALDFARSEYHPQLLNTERKLVVMEG